MTYSALLLVVLLSSVTGHPKFVAEVSSQTWTLKAPRLELRVRITNDLARAFRLSRVDSIVVELKNSNGSLVPLEGGSNRARLPDASDFVLIQPGQSSTFSFAASLERTGGDLQLHYSDASGGVWQLGPLQPGSYSFRIRYVNSQRSIRLSDGQELSDFWIGEATTDAVTISVR